MGEDVAALKLVQSIEANTKHYVEILSRAIDDCMPEPTSDVTYVSHRTLEGKTSLLTEGQIQRRRPGCYDGPASSSES